MSSLYAVVTHEGAKLFDVGILDDGTLRNPHGYPEDVVRAAVLAAVERKKRRRSNSAKKAAKTRQRRRELLVHDAAKRLLASEPLGPRNTCYVCWRSLDDTASIERGIGPECWQTVLEQIATNRKDN